MRFDLAVVCSKSQVFICGAVMEDQRNNKQRERNEY